MSDIYTVPKGFEFAPGLPPVDLPSVPAEPAARKPLRITITRGDQPKASDPWSAFPDKPPEQAAPAATVGSAEIKSDPWAAFPDKPPEVEQPKPYREVKGENAGAMGALNSMSFGLSPAIAGLAEASGIPSEAKNPDEIDINPIRPITGAAKLLHGWLTEHPDPEVKAAYQRGRESALNDERLAQEQHPYAFLAGQLGGAVATPALGFGTGASVGARALRGVTAGGIGGGLFDAGSAVSEDKTPSEIAKAGAKGAATGAALGAGGSVAADLIGKGGSKLMSIARGQRDSETEAARRVVDALRSDFETQGRKLGPEEIAAANAAGTPRSIVDTGGEKTRALMRSSANTSAEGRQAINELVQPRFEDQATRIAERVRAIAGGADAGKDLAAIESVGRKAKAPMYKKAYVAGDKPLWSPELERLMASDALPEALKGAVQRGRNRSVSEGLGGFNPKATVTPDGRLVFNKGADGAPTYPNLQFWDYAQRELRDMAKKAQRTGADEEAGALFGLHKQLNKELDRLVPEFQAARATAATFFGAENALEAGQKFVMGSANIAEARKAFAKFSPAEKELFARGFASDLAEKIEKVGYNRDVLNSIFINTPLARQKIEMALGPSRAKELEALLRVESVIDQARKALGNSTTARQLAESGLAGGGAVAAFEGIKEHDFNPVHIVTAAITVGAARHGAKVIDEKVARRVGELLASNDPAVLAKGLKIVAGSPVYFDALRRVTGATTRVTAHDVGPDNAMAGGATALQSIIQGGNKPAQTEHSDIFVDQGTPH